MPLAIETYRPDGRKASRADIEYVEHTDLFWAPSRYTINVFDPMKHDNVLLSHECRDFAIDVHAPLRQDDFAVVFEPGTKVYDERTKERYKIAADGKQIQRKPKGRSKTLTIDSRPPRFR